MFRTILFRFGVCIALMAPALASSAEEFKAVMQWLETAGIRVEGEVDAYPALGFTIVSARQDYREPAPDMCCHTYTPLRIGEETFPKGVGAHANGEIVVALDDDFTRFVAQVGIDNNQDTQGTRGSAQFIVRVDGQERFTSPVCHGGDAPVMVDVKLDGARRLELIINDAGDGYSHDQADWAIAALERKDGERVYLSDALARLRGIPFGEVPTRFSYDGKPCWELFETWERRDEQIQGDGETKRYKTTWTEPGTGFAAALDVTRFSNPQAIELQWRFSNTGSTPSGLITDLASLSIRASGNENVATFVSSTGGTTGNLETGPGFEVHRTPLGRRILTVTDGRSSNGDLPIFMLTDLQDGWGVACALGWSGAWRAEARFDKEGGMAALDAGMTPVHFRLPAGSKVSLPTALLIPFRGGESEGSNRMRRILRRYYQGRLNGEPVAPPVSFSSWFVFDNRVNALMLKELANEAAPLGIEYFCLDAGWFDGDFPQGVGNWTVNREKFPDGVRAVSNHVHGLDMKFGLWFEPERVTAGTRWARLYPHLLCGDVPAEEAADPSTGKRYLLDMAKPEAQELVFEMMDTIIREVGVDWIRYDFNISPGPVWQAIEGPEEQGLRQALYINGLYAMLDELMFRHPGLLIEQCASGGRRIDLETIRRGHTFWKSDDTRDQALMRFHQTGGNSFLLGGHLNTNYCDFKSADELLALFGGPLGFGTDFRALDASTKESLGKIIAAYKTVRPFLNLDYYPLFPQTRSKTDWVGWQFLDPDAQAGYFVAFRPESSRYGTAQLCLRALEPGAMYRLENVMSGEEQSATGADLAKSFELRLSPGMGQVWKYAAQ